MNDQALIQRICDAALLRGTFTLRSGRVSSYYLDKYLFETQPDILAELGRRFADRTEDGVDRLAGAELGGIPLVAAAAMATGKPCVLVRNQKKEYGTAKQLEGQLEEGDKVMIVEDVVTSGGQVLESASILKQAGAEIVKIVAVIDREEGGRENIESAGYRFEALFTKTDLGIAE
jgi:orotate phosphoribosyltransferase